jgi:hypothetical protein
MAESSESEQENEKLVYNDTFITNLNQNPVVLLKLLAQYDTNSTENESLKQETLLLIQRRFNTDRVSYKISCHP